MASTSFKSYIHPALHALGWLLLGYILLFYVPLTWHVDVPDAFWVWQTFVLVMMAILFYINQQIIVPKTIIKGDAVWFIAWIIITVSGMQLLSYFFMTRSGLRIEMAKLLGDKIARERFFDTFIFIITLLVIAISTSVAMLQNFQKTALRHQQLQQQQTIAELSLLKAQINPHFFFNTLNNIYSLTYINVDDSRKALHTLSRMMRYLLYSTEDAKTSLLKEVDFLKDYISLMRLRSNDKLRIIVSIPEHLVDCPMAPMLLLPFVENAFKHGIDATKMSEIKIAIGQESHELKVTVENAIFSSTERTKGEGGIGLANTKRRLELIYPDKHELVAGINNHGNFEVNLQLQLEA